MKIRWVAIGLIPLAVLALLGARQTPSEEQLKSEWAAFVKEYDAAYKEWLRPFNDAKTEEERSKVKLDFEKMPTKAYLPRAMAFARNAGKSQIGLDAWLWTFRNAQSVDAKAERSEALDAMLRDFIGSPKLESVAQGLQYGPDPAAGEKALNTLLQKSPLESVRAAALFALGAMNMPYQGGTDDQKAKAKKYFNRLLAEYPKTKAAERAKNAIFELENLQIGDVAPDFVTTDENGKSFKLSDYRGKVVIVDFWGFL